MQSGRGGMGSKKHGISGYGGSSPKTKVNKAREANLEIDKKTRLMNLKRKIGLHPTVLDAIKKHKLS